MSNHIYLLHFEVKLHHASHYLGSTTDLDRRLTDHATGRGARLTQVLLELGIEWKLARLWIARRGTNLREVERHVKRHANGRRLCPVCCGEQTRILAGAIQLPCPEMTSQTLRMKLCGPALAEKCTYTRPQGSCVPEEKKDRDNCATLPQRL